MDHANVQPYSGSPANLAVYAAFLEPGETVLGFSLPMGGHLTHGWKVSVTGKWWRSVSYGVRRDTGRVDLDEVRDVRPPRTAAAHLLRRHSRTQDRRLPRVARIAEEVGAVLVADVSHISGLIAGGAHPSPVGHAPVVVTMTHKTLRGPRGAMILCDAGHVSAVDKAVFPGLQGDRTSRRSLRSRSRSARPPARVLRLRTPGRQQRAGTSRGARRPGHDLVTGGTDTHLTLWDLTALGVSGRHAAAALDEAGLTANAKPCHSILGRRSTRAGFAWAPRRPPPAGWARRRCFSSPSCSTTGRPPEGASTASARACANSPPRSRRHRLSDGHGPRNRTLCLARRRP